MAVLFEALFLIWVVAMAWAVYKFFGTISEIQAHRREMHHAHGDD